MLKLNARHVIELTPTAPFNFDATLHKPDHFPSADNRWEPGVRWQTMRWQDTLLGLKFENRGTVARPGLTLTVWAQNKLSRTFLDELILEIGYRYNLAMNLSAFSRQFKADPQLGPALKQWRGLRPACPHSLYEYLVIAIVLQNATVRRSVNMLQALLERYGTRVEYDGQTLYGFWPPATLAQASEAELRRLKVGYRAKSLLRVSAALAMGVVDEAHLRSQSLEAQRTALLQLYGVGPASVGYILFDVFHQWDELCHISPWEQKIYSKLLFNTRPEKPATVEKLLALFERRFAPYKMLAVHYLWEDLFWKRQTQSVPWLDELIRL